MNTDKKRIECDARTGQGRAERARARKQRLAQERDRLSPEQDVRPGEEEAPWRMNLRKVLQRLEGRNEAG